MRTRHVTWLALALALSLAGTAVGAAVGDLWTTVEVEGDPWILGVDTGGETLWLTTREDGLYGHDGSAWVHHTRAGGGLRQDRFAYAIFVDAEGHKWIGRDSSFSPPDDPTVDRLDDGETLTYTGDDVWTYYSWPHEFVNNRVFSMAEDDDGNMWFGMRDENGDNEGIVELLVENDPSTTDDDDWYRFDSEELDPYVTYFLNDDVRALADDRHGRLWIGYYREGIDVWTYGDITTSDDDAWVHYSTANVLPNNFIEALHVAQDGKVWIATQGGLVVHDPSDDSWLTIAGLPGTEARWVDSDVLGYVWVATDDGVAMLYSNGTLAATYGMEDGLADASVTRIAAERVSGRIWAVTVDAASAGTTLNRFDQGFGAEANPFFVYPNPWKGGAAREAMTVFGVPDGSTVEVFDLTGERVRRFTTSTLPVLWDTLNDDDFEVPSGVYIVKATSPDGQEFFTKAAIIR